MPTSEKRSTQGVLLVTLVGIRDGFVHLSLFQGLRILSRCRSVHGTSSMDGIYGIYMGIAVSLTHCCRVVIASHLKHNSGGLQSHVMVVFARLRGKQ